ncbi:MAG TPA: YlxR family protein [Polyangia bacterium]|jgi:N utilization substance protein A|nr:YlxR family protein [Polyangia bacterium]
MTNAAREPKRTCIGCRRRVVTSALARVALSDGTIVFWGSESKRPTGRGASLHPDAECLRAALKTGAFARAFRTRLSGDRQDEANLLEQLIQRRWNRKTP